MNVVEVAPIAKREQIVHENPGGWARRKVLEYPPAGPEAEKLRKLRRELRVTLGQAARTLGIKVSELSGLERGSHVPAEPSTWAQVLSSIENAWRPW